MNLMNNKFELKNGLLLFEEDKILITDNARYKKRYRMISAAVVSILGIFIILQSMKSGRTASMRPGVILGIYGLLLLGFEYFKSTVNVINIEEVKSLKIKRIFFKEYLVIKLKNNQTRQVADIYNTDRLQEYIDAAIKLS